MKRRALLLSVSLLSTLTPGSLVLAQSTPAEFAEMSLQDLFDMDVFEQEQDTSSWSFSYQFKTAEFDGYKDGTRSLDLDEVLWSGPSESRTDKNFPVVPTVIKQRVHLMSVGYQLSPTLGLYVLAPYIEQETDHISIVPGYDEFLIKSQGIGDTIISARYQFVNSPEHLWWFSAGVSFPTGSIDEIGDTPRAHGDQQLPYTMQLGSGTYDFPLEIGYQHTGGADLSLNFSAMIRTGKNDRDYRLGNNFRLSGKYRYEINPSWGVSLAGEYQYSDDIHGQDDSIVLDAPFPYPASITNPELYGGQKLLVKAGVFLKLANNFQLGVELGKPVYQNLNGPQPGETWRSAIQISKAF